jgi:molybdenum cofactor biosynthesis enzyme
MGDRPAVVDIHPGRALEVRVSITLDTYSHVDLDMQAIAAARIAALVIGDQE